MKRNLQVYLRNAVDILQFGSEPDYTAILSDNLDPYYTAKAGYLHLGELAIDLPEVPSRETLVVKTVEGMKAEVQRIRAEAESKAKEMEQQINDLLMLGHTERE